MVWKNLIRQAGRSTLTVLGIAIGVAAVVALGAFASSIMVNYGSALGLSNELLVSQANALDVAFSNLDEDLGVRLAAVPDVTNVDPGVFTWINMGDTPYFLVYGYEVGSVSMRHYRIVEGRSVTGPRQIAIGRRAADALKLNVDGFLRVYGTPYRIVGIYETGQGVEETGGIVTLEESQIIAQKQRQVSLFQVGVRPGTDLEQVRRRIEMMDANLSVSIASSYESGQEWTSLIQGFAWGIASIAILIGGLGMMSAMVMSVLERTREIGTLRAVGWSKKRIILLILGESFLLSLTGGLVGIGLGAAMAWAASQSPGIGALLEGGLGWNVIAQGMAIALALGAVGGVYPAWAAASLPPVEALRYERGGAGGSLGGGGHGIWARFAQVGDQSFRNLWRRRTRTLISAAGISVGVAALIMLGGITEGTLSQMNSLAGSSGTGNLTLMQRDVADMSLSSLDERLVRMIQAMPQVESASPFVLGFVSTESMPLFLIGGIELNSPVMSHYRLVVGRPIRAPKEILLGRTAADVYKVGMGDVITLYDNRYRVVGIYETGVAFEDGGSVMALSEAQSLMGRARTVTFIFVDIVDPRQADAVVEALNQRFPEARASLSSEFAQNSNDMQSFFAMSAAIRVLALVVGGIVVTNTMIMSVFERTREIGVLRALGWSGPRIWRQILRESLYLCTVAAVLGSGLGVAVLMAITYIPYFGQFLKPAWRIEIFVSAVAVALLLGLLGGFYPAWRAGRLPPVEALRYE